MAVVDADDDARERFVAQRRDDRPDECGQRWHDDIAFDNLAELQAFLDARRAEGSEQAVSPRWRSSLRPAGYRRAQADQRELKRAFAHGTRPSAEVWTRLRGEVTSAVDTEQ